MDSGIVVKNLKLFKGASTWKTRLALGMRKAECEVYIETYSLANIGYITELLDKSKQHIRLIAHSKFKNEAIEIANRFPNVEIRLHSKTHSKIALLSPETVIFSSANFGFSGWHENSVGIHCKEIFDLKLLDFLEHWERCQTL